MELLAWFLLTNVCVCRAGVEGLGWSVRLNEMKVPWGNKAGCMTLEIWTIRNLCEFPQQPFAWRASLGLNRFTHGEKRMKEGWWRKWAQSTLCSFTLAEMLHSDAMGRTHQHFWADGSSVFINATISQLRWKSFSRTLLQLQVRWCSDISVKGSVECCVSVEPV